MTHEGLWSQVEHLLVSLRELGVLVPAVLCGEVCA